MDCGNHNIHYPLITDTHCHIADNAFDADREETIQRALAAGVSRMIVACCDETEYPAIAALCRQHPGHLFPTLGLHPENMADDLDSQLERLDALLEPETIVAVGEIGIDLHWDQSRLEDQKKALIHQLQWCLDHDLPAILHIRDAMPEFLAFMNDFWKEAHMAGETHLGKITANQATSGEATTDKLTTVPSERNKLKAVLHCYSGTAEQFMEAQQYGIYYIGIGGTSTYKKSAVPEVLKALPRELLMERLLLETDCPYLSPVPHRGHRNEPAYTAITARYLADLLETDPETLDRQTQENAERLFPRLKGRDNIS